MPSPIPAVATEHVHQLNAALPGLLAGYYLHGSLALSAFDPAQSDVDFIALVSRPPGAADITRLRAVHQRAAVRSTAAPPRHKTVTQSANAIVEY